MDSRKNILMGRYELGKLLGQGSFAKVYYARCLQTGQSVAIKVIGKDTINEHHLEEQIIREIAAMRLVKHPNIVELLEVMASKKKIYLVLEYAKGGEIFKKILRGRLREHIARKYFQQLISAVDYCHSRGVYHRDLKPENLLLDGNGNLKVSDFGLSSLVNCKSKKVLLQTLCGTRAYSAPEVINQQRYDGAKADIWSCGVSLFVFLAGYNPFQHLNLMEQHRKITRCEYEFPNCLHSEVQRLIARMLDPNPRSRISIAKIKENRWFLKGLDDKKMIEKEDTKYQFPSNVTEASNSSGSSNAEEKEAPANILNLNAFHILSLSAGLDLSYLIDDSEQKAEAWFTAEKPAPAIISELENMAETLMLKVMKKDSGVLRMESSKEGRKGVLAIQAEIFQVTDNFHMVEIKKYKGDTAEYQKLLEEQIRPALKDIVCVWLGDQQQQHS